jgi:hypothetical protein
MGETIAADPGGNLLRPFGLAGTGRLIARLAWPYAVDKTRASRATIRLRFSQQN